MLEAKWLRTFSPYIHVYTYIYMFVKRGCVIIIYVIYTWFNNILHIIYPVIYSTYIFCNAYMCNNIVIYVNININNKYI
jgi:hypothetical protein